MKNISLIIISYNTCGLTLECLHSVFSNIRFPKSEFEVIVFDNASTDGSADAIEELFGNRLTLIKSDTNIGFAAGNNAATEKVTSDYILLLNPDTLVLNNAIDNIYSFAELNPSAKLWGGRTLFADHSLNPGSCWSRQTLWSLVCQVMGFSSLFRRSSIFNPEGIGGWDREGERYVDIISGCFLLIKREFWIKLSGFSPDYFMYGEDADLCLRAKKFGAKPLISSTATIVHYGGASEKVRADKLVRLIKAKALLIKDHFSHNLSRIGVLLLSGWPLSRYIAHKLFFILGRKNSNNSLIVWKEVWNRRNEWL